MKPFSHPLLSFLQDKKFVLASTSPRRLEILQSLGIPNIEVIASDFEENLDKADYTPGQYVLETALGKALAVRDRLQLNRSGAELPHVILAADTVIESSGCIFEKPKSMEDNIASIVHFRDDENELRNLTGLIILVWDDATGQYKITKHLETTYIKFDPDMTDAFIKLYCATEEGFGAAGGYKIQGLGSLLIKEIRGDYYNVAGLPFRATFVALQKLMGISL